MQTPVYLDYNATTPLDERVLEAMMPYLQGKFGNPSSSAHWFGWQAVAAVELARKRVAECIGATDPQEIIFTSGATESVNLALRGVADIAGSGHIISVATEHKAVLDTLSYLQRKGFSVTLLAVDEYGLIDMTELESAFRSDTLLVSVMHANNETGTINDIASIGAVCRERGVLFHTDATQSVGKYPFNVLDMNVDFASFTAHKMYGSKGSGVLYLRKCFPRIAIEPLLMGGGQEFGLRSGTHNVAGIVGLQKALELCTSAMSEESLKCRDLRDGLYTRLLQEIPSIELNGVPINDPRHMPGTLNISFPGVLSSLMMSGINDVAMSAASACGTSDGSYSHVLRAMNVGDVRGESAIRISVGRYTTNDEINYAAGQLVAQYQSLADVRVA
ncbi:MAG: cysteine desulfurase [Candidatus Kapabacteria bacterium]|nr:cysteine desulfurase [Candidatus Kapabacteria bacterium]